MGGSTNTSTVTSSVFRLKGPRSSENGGVEAGCVSDDGWRGQLCVGAERRAAATSSASSHGAGIAFSSALNAHPCFSWLFDGKQNDGFMSSQFRT